MSPPSPWPIHWWSGVLCPLYITSDFKPKMFTLSPVVHLTKMFIPSLIGFIPQLFPACPLAKTSIFTLKTSPIIRLNFTSKCSFSPAQINSAFTRKLFILSPKKRKKKNRKTGDNADLQYRVFAKGRQHWTGKNHCACAALGSIPFLITKNGDSAFWRGFRWILGWFGSVFVQFCGFLCAFGVFFFGRSTTESLGDCISPHLPSDGSSDREPGLDLFFPFQAFLFF